MTFWKVQLSDKKALSLDHAPHTHAHTLPLTHTLSSCCVPLSSVSLTLICFCFFSLWFIFAGLQFFLLQEPLVESEEMTFSSTLLYKLYQPRQRANPIIHRPHL